MATITGTAGNDRLTATADGDRLEGLGGDDILIGYTGADTLVGGAGIDSLFGGGGDDTFLVSADDGANYFDGGLGSDLILATTNSMPIKLFSLKDIEAISSNGYSGVTISAEADWTSLDFRNTTLVGISSIYANSRGSFIYGSQGSELIVGTSASDTLGSGGGNDEIRGGDGDDILIVGSRVAEKVYAGAATYFGENGDDQFAQVSTDGAVSYLSGGSGSDTYEVEPSLVQQPGSDFLELSGVADGVTDFKAGYGGDRIRVPAYNGFFLGWDHTSNPFQAGYMRLLQVNNDTLLQIDRSGSGSAYRDVLLLRNVQATDLTVSNFVNGFSPNGLGDKFVGTALSDTIQGSRYDDFIYGNAGNDILQGDAGADYLDGGKGNDGLLGGDGADRLTGGADNDYMLGGAGDDVFLIGTKAGSDSIEGGTGYDSIVASADNAVLGWKDVREVESISSGGFANFRIVGTGSDQTFDLAGMTVSGVRSIDGGGGADTIIGTTADDTIIGGSGNDTLNGGVGNDVFQFKGASGVDTIDGGEGYDTVQAGADNAALNWGSLTSIEMIDGDGFANVRIIGGSANDIIDLSTHLLSDIAGIDGGAGDDMITGSVLADTIIGGKGNDHVVGGEGDDIFLFAAAAGLDVIDGGAGFDTVKATASNATLNGNGLSHIEEISGNGFSNVKVVGSSGSDTINLAAVSVSGIAAIEGGNGIDTITGSASADTILGGQGADQLSGGAGADIFDYNSTSDSRSSAIDTILDFDQGVDCIDLSSIDPNSTLAGDQQFTFVGMAAFGGARGELRIDSTAPGYTRILGDIDGNKTVDFEIRLFGTYVLSETDFIF